jgi:hypothetical protein
MRPLVTSVLSAYKDCNRLKVSGCTQVIDRGKRESRQCGLAATYGFSRFLAISSTRFCRCASLNAEGK